MTRRETPEVRKHRIILGLVLGLATFGVALPATFVLLAGWLDRVLGFPDLLSPGTGAILAAACMCVGLLWITWSHSFIVFVGRGSPVEAFGRALEPTRQLVTSGPYAYLRHPMVFGVLWVLLGIAFYIGSISGLILAPILGLIAWAYLVTWEERGLERRFGEEYIRYRDNVRALIPHLKPYAAEPAGSNE